MGRNRSPLRFCLATLCAVLAVVFAGASASSVVDRIQHAGHVPHEHQLHLSFEASDYHHADHHDGHAADGDQHGGAGDGQAGAGHHHADVPSGALTLASASAPTVAASRITAAPVRFSARRGLRPAGLDRPPKWVANRV